MTGQTLLNYMELVDPELQLQSGEANVVRGLLALNIAQDLWEAMLAGEAETRTQALPSAFTTTANQEFTTIPTGYLRTDRLEFIDPTTSKVAWEIVNVRSQGQTRIPAFAWAFAPAPTTGKPKYYWNNGTQYWWQPTPDATYSVRFYGLTSATDITASGTFLFFDVVAFPLATLAAKILMTGLGDDTKDVDALAGEVMTPALKAYRAFNQDRAPGFEYRYRHST